MIAALVLAPVLAAELTLVTGARVLAPAGDRWLEGVAIALDGDRIVAVAPLSTFQLEGARVIEAAGLHAVPGLVDLHTHLLLHPYDEAPWDEQVLAEQLELRVLRAVPAARATLAAGFTTVRELGTEGAGFADVALRDAFAAGLAEGPRVLASTRAIVATGSYGPMGFDPRFALPKGAQEADGVDGVRVAVRQQVAAGADWIKVYADYRRRPGAPATPTFSSEELEAIVDEARSAGLPVAAHATTDGGIRRACLAGVATIEHGTEASPDTLALLASRGVVLVPTLAASDAVARQGGWDGSEPAPERVRRARATFAAALAAGVAIGCGSDAGVFAHGDNARELELMVAAGMSPAAALRSATLTAAAVLGRSDELGALRAGLAADVVLLGGDPLRGTDALRDVRLVLQGGRVALDRRFEREDERREVVAVCERMLAAYSARRFTEVRELFAPGATVTVDFTRAGGAAREVVPAADFLARAEAGLAQVERFAEWMAGEPRVVVDGGIAFVWSPFVLEADSSRAAGHNGVQMAKLDGRWRVTALCFTNRELR